MAKYLVSGSYTAEGAKGLMKDGRRRDDRGLLFRARRSRCRAHRRRARSRDVTAVALATNASGAVRLSTTVLLTPADVDAAVKKTVNYTPPGR